MRPVWSISTNEKIRRLRSRLRRLTNTNKDDTGGYPTIEHRARVSRTSRLHRPAHHNMGMSTASTSRADYNKSFWCSGVIGSSESPSTPYPSLPPPCLPLGLGNSDSQSRPRFSLLYNISYTCAVSIPTVEIQQRQLSTRPGVRPRIEAGPHHPRGCEDGCSPRTCPW